MWRDAASLRPRLAQRQLDRAYAGLGAQGGGEILVDADAAAAVEIELAGGALAQQLEADRGRAGAMPGQR